MHPSMIPLCIYHAGCADGFAAAWAVRKHYGDGKVEFHEGRYGEAPPDVTGRQVILVDFSYKRQILLAMIEQAASVLILDHHKTAQEDLQDLGTKARAVFDMERSGAVIAWEHFHPGQMTPLLFDYIQDRDLWRFKLPSTREVSAALYSHPFDFAVWDDLVSGGIPRLIAEGIAINRNRKANLDAFTQALPRTVNLWGYQVQCANVPWMYASELGGILAKDAPFSITYFDDAEGRKFSLRSDPAGLDVSKIAEAFGGGGHKHAAGFRMNREEALDFELVWGEVK